MNYQKAAKETKVLLRKRLKLSHVLIFVLFCVLFVWFVDTPHTQYIRENLSKLPQFHRDLTVVNMTAAVHQPRQDGSNIFFIETREPIKLTANLTRRQACAVESAGESRFRFENSIKIQKLKTFQR
jgi:hypothetical protein